MIQPNYVLPFHRFLMILWLSAVFTSCRSQQSEMPYQVGQAYLFGITVWNDSSAIALTDTLKMTVKKRGLIGGLLGMHRAEWKSVTYPAIRQMRGMPMSNDMVELQLPVVFDYFENENIVIAGYPAWSRTMLVGFTATSDHRFVRGYGKLSGKRMTQVRTVLDSTLHQFRGEELLCKVSEGHNADMTEEFGRYTIRTLYHDKHGFLKITVNYPNGKNVVMKYLGKRND